MLILDEPTIGLDPNQIRDVRRLIRDLGQEHTLLLSTHILSEVEATCDRAMVIHRGELVASGTISELRQLQKSDTVQLTLRDPDQKAASVLESAASARFELHRAGDELDPSLMRATVVLSAPSGDRGVSTEKLVSALVRAGIMVREVTPARATLEDVFAELTGSAPAASQCREGQS